MTTQTQTPGHARTELVYRPFYAAAGAGDLAVKQLRRSASQVADQAHNFQQNLGHAQGRFALEYDRLVVRGKAVVTQIRQQPASQALEAQVEKTERAAKQTVTAARRGTQRTTNDARATVASAKKTAETAIDAAEDAADKIG
jgi:hypothetical protein